MSVWTHVHRFHWPGPREETNKGHHGHGVHRGYLNRQCTGDHRHVHFVSGKAKAAAEYTEDFCKAIVSGIAAYLEKRDGDLNGMEVEAQKCEPIDPSDYDYENRFSSKVGDVVWTMCPEPIFL